MDDAIVYCAKSLFNLGIRHDIDHALDAFYQNHVPIDGVDFTACVKRQVERSAFNTLQPKRHQSAVAFARTFFNVVMGRSDGQNKDDNPSGRVAALAYHRDLEQQARWQRDKKAALNRRKTALEQELTAINFQLR